MVCTGEHMESRNGYYNGCEGGREGLEPEEEIQYRHDDDHHG